MDIEYDPNPLETMNEKTIVWANNREYMVSTVKLSVDHGFGSTPLWFETYIFPARDGEIADWSEVWGQRYTNKESAEAGHKSACARLAAGELELYEYEAMGDE